MKEVKIVEEEVEFEGVVCGVNNLKYCWIDFKSDIFREI